LLNLSVKVFFKLFCCSLAPEAENAFARALRRTGCHGAAVVVGARRLQHAVLPKICVCFFFEKKYQQKAVF
jgi:hypothetical protein